MSWESVYRGNGVPRKVELPDPPPWRTFPRPTQAIEFQPPAGLVEAVNAAIAVRRPLLVTGSPGSGKSSLIDSVAAELQLGRVLRWHITSRSTLSDGLYRYDVLARIHTQQLTGRSGPEESGIGPFLQLGPLGTALAPAGRPRALLIDEIDKSDLDLPSDLLDVLERGEFEITELARLGGDPVGVREWNSTAEVRVEQGRVTCTEFPFIVMTSNGEREFPAPFLRRCIRFEMPAPDTETLSRIVAAHLKSGTVTPGAAALIETFVRRVRAGEQLAVDQLLNAVHLLDGDGPVGAERERLIELVLRELSGV